MPPAMPFALGPFMVDAAGRLSTACPATASFTCRWRRRVIRSRLVPDPTGQARIVSRVVLGRMPSTGTGAAEAVRRNGFAVLRRLPASLPIGWQLRLLPDHRLSLEVEQPFTLPTTATDLVARLTMLFLRLEPYIDLVDELGMAQAGVQT
jgi:hypothetical protein